MQPRKSLQPLPPVLRRSAVVLAFAFSLASPAAAFTARDGSRVNPVSDGIFEVVPRSSGDGRLFWCGAADYAQRALKAPWDARLSISRARGQSETTKRRSAVQFTLDPKLAGVSGAGNYGSINTLERGDTMSVRDAFNLCNELPIGF